MTSDVDVLVVGCGPTGLALANHLGQAGVSVLAIEQDDDVATLPRAVSVDDEAMRFMQYLGLLEQATSIALRGTGTRYYGIGGRCLAYARGPERPPFGHPVKNPIDHPEFQRMLLGGLERFDCVQSEFCTKLLGLEQLSDVVRAEIERSDGSSGVVTARFVLGCDGGRSLVRERIGARMLGSTFEQRWLVVDTIGDEHDERFAMHHGDPARPHVIVPGRDGRCRYEFLLRPGEGEEDDQSSLLSLGRQMVAPYRELAEQEVVRCAVYRFHALVADRWRSDRALLLGDAAHMMPPFAGQGLNSGLRDAFNLGWKLGHVIRQGASPALLDTYERERRPHVEAMIRLSVRLGSVVMTTSRTRARLRDASCTVARVLPPARRFLEEMRFKPPARYDEGLVLKSRPGDLAGFMLPQPRVLVPSGELKPLDDLLGRGFALIGVDLDPPLVAALPSPLWERLGAVRVALRLGDRLPLASEDVIAAADADGELALALGPARGRLLLVRPDRFVLGSFVPHKEPDFVARLEAALGLGTPSTVSTAA